MIRECPKRGTQTSYFVHAGAVRAVAALGLALADETKGGGADCEVAQVSGECWAAEGEGEAGKGWGMGG